MGMYYSIEPKSDKIKGLIFFPNPLSYFFEQVGGYEEKSVAVQIEHILKIDLSIFQKTYYEEFNESETNLDDSWLQIESLLEKVKEFELKIQSDKEYFSKVIFNPSDNRQIMLDILLSKPEELTISQEENPLSLYPVDNGIITAENLENGLRELKIILEKLKTQAVKQVRLLYM